MENLIENEVDITLPNEDFTLKGSFYKISQKKYPKPLLINLPGLLEHRESKFVKYFSHKFAEKGYYVISYDYRAHGETAKETGRNWLKQIPKIFSDIHLVIDWIYENHPEEVLKNEIFLFGRSLGGAIILTHGFQEKRVKKLIALCTRYDYHSFRKVPFPEKVIKKISPIYFLKKDEENRERILLAHCKDDKQIPFENLNSIKARLELPSENVLIFEEGGHSFKNHKDEILLKSIEFLKS
ncbi:MAG: hypothetical protein EU548_04095 [Promethearchaeota archaeon]|nr:MAG: hypothetical protein EU548_04095 [Candidatus Lokiarchaeota archaeon]